MKIARGLVTASLLFLITVSSSAPAAAAPEGRADAPAGQLTWGVHISLAPTWFDPAETSGIITPFMVLYALHDPLVKAMPGNGMAASTPATTPATPPRSSASPS